jgi:hypothetical protein
MQQTAFAAQRLAFSRAAPLHWYKCTHQISLKNASDLGPRSGVGWNAVLGRQCGLCARAALGYFRVVRAG